MLSGTCDLCKKDLTAEELMAMIPASEDLAAYCADCRRRIAAKRNELITVDLAAWIAAEAAKHPTPKQLLDGEVE